MVINSDGPRIIREDPSALTYSELQERLRRRLFADRLAQARQVREKESIRGMRKAIC